MSLLPTVLLRRAPWPSMLALVAGCARPPSPAREPSPASAPTLATEPSAAATATEATATRDASPAARHAEILGCVLEHPDVRAYVHPESAGRVPVSVHVDRRIEIGAPPQAYDHPVQWSGPADALVDVSVLREDGEHATVELAIDEEGVRGRVGCVRQDGRWHPGAAALAEH